MKKTERLVTATVYTSEVHPSLTTEDAELGGILAWADAHPAVYKVVIGKRSAPFGEDSSTYFGYQRGKEPLAVLQRLQVFRRYLEGDIVVRDGTPASWTEAYQHCLADSFWTWRARFTLEYIEDKNLQGGLFRQFDGTYDRGCVQLDYTPKTRDEVVDHFLAWCNDGPNKFPTQSVRIDNKTVRTYPGVEPTVAIQEVAEDDAECDDGDGDL
jgi:hypothetical protein